ncbi:hypothetical protein HII36_09770 [Nonomuraea sp. NN258]|uniref:SbcC/MukB-like Walker B domain-containing protein n=1 Tax=Nonomuraea antri TaxID=2730852 RepID=UPI00156955DB|nr:SbcC/MukB-like Walker B domain-containing protein [Nonomuraea antri]NRQ32123.1 hypothetical protein [Nonomuraea antri]
MTISTLRGADDLRLGEPDTDGRWQPTRAGVVNSWAWAEEVFYFADGWLALAGPNGSGKSLTASMLVTVLLDAEVSQTALSVSGKASGTLTSRHTDRNEREDRTGAWWLEYGRHDPATGETEFLTTGVWLRSTGSELQRAFFLAPGRVGHDLLLQRDREPVRIVDLAEQLAEIAGELFVSSSALRSASTGILASVGEERHFKSAIRTRLFAPLDEVQFDALIGVLRSLRSVRTAEAISPNRMREVLTEALPALDPDQLKLIAEAMERIAELENQLERARTEAGLLNDADRRYRTYLGAVAQLQAAELVRADNDHGDLTREARTATERRDAAVEEKRAAARERDQAAENEAALMGEIAAADSALRDHAGAELPLLEQRAAELADTARTAEENAAEAQGRAEVTAREAEESADVLQEAQSHLEQLVQGLRSEATVLGAEAALDRMIAVLGELTHAERTVVVEAPDMDELVSTPQAWTEARTGQIGRVRAALRANEEAQHRVRGAADDRRRAEDSEDAARESADVAGGDRLSAEEGLLLALEEWDAANRHLGRPVAGFEFGRSDDGEGRLALGELRAWLMEAAETARGRIDLAGRERQASADEAVAAAARAEAGRARTRHADAASRWETARSALAETEDEAADEAAADAEREAQAIAEHEAEFRLAAEEVAEAELNRADGLSAVVQAGGEWIARTARWRNALRWLNGDDIPIPELPSANDVQLDPAATKLSVVQAHARADRALHEKLARARETVNGIGDEIDVLEAELAEARQTPPLPPAPTWRRPRPSDGVPLWALVDFAPDLAQGEADRIEGALLVAGLLDALVMPSGRLVAGELVLTPGGPIDGRTLADVLTPDDGSPLPAPLVAGLLRAIPVGRAESGTLTHGVLTAACPEGYRSAFIGRSARERARRERVAALESWLSTLEGRLGEARAQVRERQRDISEAEAEADSFPDWDALAAARQRLAELSDLVSAAQRSAAHRRADADLVLEKSRADLAAAALRREARIAAERQATFLLEEQEQQTDEQAEATAQAAEESAVTAAESTRLRTIAAEEQAEAEAEHARFPGDRVTEAENAQAAEDRAEERLIEARRLTVEAIERHRKSSEHLQQSLKALNTEAKLPDGSLLPTSGAALDHHGEENNRLVRSIDGCAAAARRCSDLLDRARRDLRTAAGQAQVADRLATAATNTRQEAVTARATVDKIRALHGAEYLHLIEVKETLTGRLAGLKEKIRTLDLRKQEAGERAAAEQSTLNGIAPRRESSEIHREACFRAFARLAEERLASLPDDLPSDSAGRPAHLTAGLVWARRVLSDQPPSTERMNTLIANRNRAHSGLENSVRTASTALARFNRQVTLATIEGTDWRRAVVADPDASRGEDLGQALLALRASIDQLEGDLREDVKRTMKTSLFTKLRRDILERKQAAHELVRQVRGTLKRVRTGVADVGVQVAWDVKKDDEDSQRMVDLITSPPSDETFDQMYSVLRQRMDETVGEPWLDRVAHTFDYRSWHEWEITVTHSSFGDGSSEIFRKVTARSNPLESLSTGERRLATMLPLLAAAWSMYSAEEFKGPRLLSIDEIDAAFDEPNLRQILGLLRSWEFDVLATTPSITPMMKREAGRAMVHQVVAAGRRRVTIPWHWSGEGEPRIVTPEPAQ